MATGPLEWEHIMRRSASAPRSSSRSRTPPARPAAAAAAAATAAATAARNSAAAAAAAAGKRYSSAPQAFNRQELFRVKGFRSVKVTNGAVSHHMGSTPQPTTDPDPPPPYDLVMALDRSSSAPPRAPSSTGSASSHCSSSRTTSSWNSGVLRPKAYKPSPANKKKQVSFRLAPGRSSDGAKPKGTPAQRSSRRKSPSSSSPPSKPVRHANGPTHSSNPKVHERVAVVGDGNGSRPSARRGELSPTKPRPSLPKESSPPKATPRSFSPQESSPPTATPRSSSSKELPQPTAIPRSPSPKKSSPPKATSSPPKATSSPPEATSTPPDEDSSLVVSMDDADLILGNFGRSQETPSSPATGSQPSLVDSRERRAAAPVPSRRKNSHRRAEVGGQSQPPLATSRPKTNGHSEGIGRERDVEPPPRHTRKWSDGVGRRHTKPSTNGTVNGTDSGPAKWRENPQVLVVGGDGWAGLGKGTSSSSSSSSSGGGGGGGGGKWK